MQYNKTDYDAWMLKGEEEDETSRKFICCRMCKHIIKINCICIIIFLISFINIIYTLVTIYSVKINF